MSVESPNVFVSYAHESDEYKDAVLHFCATLRRSGLRAMIDQYEPFPPQGWPRWMLKQIREAKFVLIACSPKYLLRFEGLEEKGTGLGVKWEGAIVTQDIYEAESDNRKFIPILIQPEHRDQIPAILRPYTHFDVASDVGFESLYRLLTNQPAIIAPPIGDIVPLDGRTIDRGSSPKVRKEIPGSRIQGKLSVTPALGGWGLQLTLANVSDLPLYVDSPNLRLAAPSDAQNQADEEVNSIEMEFIPVRPVTGPLLPTQRRDYVLPAEGLAILHADQECGNGRPSIIVKTPVATELVMDDDSTADTILSAILAPHCSEPSPDNKIRVPTIIDMLKKRCTDQTGATFKVYPPIEVVADRTIVENEATIPSLSGLVFTVQFDDGVFFRVSTEEFLVFIEQLIIVTVESQQVAMRLERARPRHAVNFKLNTRIPVNKEIDPKLAKMLFEKVAFESVSFLEVAG